MSKLGFKSLLRRLGYEIKRTAPSHLAPDPFEVQAGLLVDSDALTIFDIGAHRGQTARKYALKFPQAIIYSFEPSPDAFKELQEAVSAHDNIRPHRLAIADSVGRRTLYASRQSATNSLLPRPKNQRRYFPIDAETIGRIQVDTATLDAFCEQASVSHINILKMDVQGGELLVLEGASGLLSRNCIDLIFTEAMFVPHYEGGPLFHELWRFLAQFEYSLYDLFLGPHATNGQLRQGDAIFISREIRTVIINTFDEEP